MRLNNPAKVSQLVVAELGLRPGSDPDAGAHRRGEKITGRNGSRQAAAPVQSRDEEGRDQGRKV